MFAPILHPGQLVRAVASGYSLRHRPVSVEWENVSGLVGWTSIEPNDLFLVIGGKDYHALHQWYFLLRSVDGRYGWKCLAADHRPTSNIFEPVGCDDGT